MRLRLAFAVVMVEVVACGPAMADPAQPRAELLRIPREVDFAAEAARLRADPPGEARRLRPREVRPDRVRFDDGADRLERLGVRGGDRFGDRGRVYVFAADGETAVGYNFTRGEDGWAREGFSSDAGAFMGEAQAGVAWRRGDLQASFGYVRRDVERPGRFGRGFDDDVVAFQFSFTPGR